MINKLFKQRYFLVSIQFLTLFVFVVLIYGAIGISTDDPDFAKILRNTNLANLIVWSYWWPFIIVTAILFGRFWCTICPMELVTSFFSKIGFRKKPGKVLKSGWLITLFYALILIVGIHTLAIHRIPQYMAIYMLMLFVIASVIGLIYEKRTFCTHICPIGHLLGLYAMLSSKKLRVIDKNVCASCKTKDCISKSKHYNFVGRSCTSELYPAELEDNRSCILCGQCHKSCTKDNIAIQKQRLAADLFSDIHLSWAEISFFMMLSSFVIYEILSEWLVSKALIMALPNIMNQILQTTGALHGTVKAVSLFILTPLVFYGFFALLKKWLSKENWKTVFTQLVVAILPITASMHLLKALLKTTSRIPYWDYVFNDPKGVETAQKITENADVLDKNFIHSLSPFISALAIIFSIGGLLLSQWVIQKQNYKNTNSKYVSILVSVIYAGLFFVTLLAWRYF